jgi:hypothetical protein
VLDALDVLVDRSLVAVLPGDDDASPRYRLLESPKAFALERLAAAGEVEATQLRLAHAVRGLFAEAWDAYMSGRLARADCRACSRPIATTRAPRSAGCIARRRMRLQISAVLHARIAAHADGRASGARRCL